MRNRKGILSLFFIIFMFILVSCGPATKKAVTPPLPDSTTYVYTGNPITYNVERSTLYSVSNTTQTNAGTYDVVLTLRDKNNYAWVTTSSSDDLVYKFIISPMAIEKPTVEAKTYPYTGSEITFDIPTSSYYSISNNKATDAGTYIATVSLSDKNNLVWADGTKDDLTFNFSIVNVDLSYATISNVNNEYVYTGQEIKPIPTVKFGNDTLVLNQDYNLTYQNNINVGQAKVIITGIGNFNGSKTINYNIVKADPTIVAPTAKTLTYNGQAQELINPGTTSGGTFEYKLEGGSYSSAIPQATNAGTYKVYYKVVGNSNYKDSAEGSIDVTIAKANYDLSNIKFENKTYTYDGLEKELTITGNLPSGVTVTYETNKLTNAGSVVAKAKFSGDTLNYNPISDMTATLTISKAIYDMSAVKFENASYTYDGTEKTILISGNLPEGVTVVYENNKLTNAGEIIATAKFSGDENHEAIPSMSATLTIDKANFDMSGIKFEDAAYTYDGLEKEIVITGALPEGVTASYINNKLTNAGNVTATAKFNHDNQNYNNIADMTAVLTINKAESAVGTNPVGVNNLVYTGEELELVTAGTAVGGTLEYKVGEANYSASLPKATNVGTYTIYFRVKGDNNHNDSEASSIEVKIGKATYDMSAVKFNDLELTYNTKEQKIEITGELPEGVTVSYENNTLINVGSTLATAKFNVDDNHTEISDMQATLTIVKADPVITAPTAKELTYTGEALELINEASTTGGKVVYKLEGEENYSEELPKGTNAGEYKVYYKVAGDNNYNDTLEQSLTITIKKADPIITKEPIAYKDEMVYNGSSYKLLQGGEAIGGTIWFGSWDETWQKYNNFCQGSIGQVYAGTWKRCYYVEGDSNHNDSAFVEFVFIIKKATYDMSGVAFDNATYKYTGEEFEITITSALPDGVSVEYENNTLTNVGSTLATAKFSGDYNNYNEIADMKATLTITKADSSITKAPAAITNLVYNTKAQDLITEGETSSGTLMYKLEGGEYSTSIPQATNHGTYNVWYKVVGDENHEDLEEALIEGITIAKATPTVTAPKAIENLVYTGEALDIATAGSTNGGEMVYSLDDMNFVSYIPKRTDAGTYKLYYMVCENANYLSVDSTFIEIEIAKATYDMSAVTFADKTETYTGQEITITITGTLPEGVTVSYTNNALTNVGSTLATAKFSGNANYEAIADKTATLTITKATYDMSAVSFADKTVTYDGTEQSITIKGTLPIGVSVEYTNNTLTNAGSILATAKFEGDSSNYEVIADMTATLTINKASWDYDTLPEAIADLVYDGTAQDLIIGAVAENGIVEYKLDNGQYSTNIPMATNAGSYKVYYRLNGDDNHEGKAEAFIDVQIAKANPVLTAPVGKTLLYDGTSQVLIEAGSTTAGTLEYKLDDGEYSTDIPEAIGSATSDVTYKIYYRVVGGNNYYDIAETYVTTTITITKFDPVFTAPTAIENLVYTGSAQTLINAGTTADGTFAYSLDNNTFNATLPTGTNVDDYTVYYKVLGDSSHNDSAVFSIAVSIAKADSAYTKLPVAKELTYNGSAQALIIAASTSHGTIYYSLDGTNYQTEIVNGTLAGNYTVYYKLVGDNNHKDFAPQTIDVTIAKAASTYTVTPTAKNNLVYNRQEQALLNAGSSSCGQILYKIGEEEYSSTIPTRINHGQYKVYYKLVGDANHNDIAEAYYNVSIEQLTITSSNTTITLAENEYTFNDEYFTPEVTSVVVNGYTLPKDAYYEISYNNNYNAGTASVIITAIDLNYHGSVTKNFTIYKKSIVGAVVTLENTSFVYTGSKIEPTISLVKLNDTTITSDDYEVSYPNAINVGNYEVTITGKRNYKNSVTTSFTIVTQDVNINGVTMSFNQDTFTFNNSSQKPTITLVDGNNNDRLLVANQDYTLAFENITTTAKEDTTSAGTIRVTASGIGNIYTGTITKDYVINKKVLDDSQLVVTLTDHVYDGQSFTPQIISALDGSIDIKSLLYITANSAKTNAGEHQATIRFNENNKNYEDLTSDITRTWYITPKSSASLTISDIDDVPYTTNVKDNGATPTVSIYDGIVPLILDTDFDLAYSNNKGADITNENVESTANVTITFKGNYTGQRQATFKIINSEFTITYVDPNNENNNSTQKYHAADTSIVLKSLERTGYNGVWSSSKGNLAFGSTTNPDTVYGDITLTAVWEVIEYSITYYLSEGANGEGNPAKYTVETPLTQLANPTNTKADEFLGWYTYVQNQDNDSYTGDTITSIGGGTIGNISLYAKWKFKIYNINYHLTEGATNPNTKVKITPDEDYTLLAATKDYYEFVGWYDSETDGNKIEVLININNDINLYSRFVKKSYTISYSYNISNTIQKTNSNVLSYQLDDSIVLVPATALKHQFIGWYLNDQYSGDPITTFDTSAPEDITIYGKFIAANTTAKTYLNDAESALPGTISENINVIVGQNASFTAIPNNGYTFLGWYIGNEEVTTGLSNNGLTVTFALTTTETVYIAKYARYSLTYTSSDATKGTVSISATKISTIIANKSYYITQGDVVTLTATTINNGCAFIGWYCDDAPVSTDLVYEYTMLDSNVSFEAKWISLTVSVNNGSLGTASGLTGQYIKTDTPTITATPGSGIIFLGWYVNNAKVNSSKSYQITIPDEDTVYVAMFVENNVSVVNYQIVYDNENYEISYNQISGLTPEQSVEGTTLTYTMPQTSTDYLFAGWWNSASNSRTLINHDENHTIQQDISWSCTVAINENSQTIYALWVRPHSSIVRIPNDSEAISNAVTTTFGLVTDGITFTADENIANYIWSGWYSNEACTVSASENNVLTLSYANTYQNLVEMSQSFAGININYWTKWVLSGINILAGANGTVDEGSKDADNHWTITATPNAGYLFDYWEHNGSKYYTNPLTNIGTNESPEYILDGSGTYTAIFKIREDMPYKQIFHLEGADDIVQEYSNGKTGLNVDLTANSYTGYTLDYVTANGSSTHLTPSEGKYYLPIIAENDTVSNASHLDYYYSKNKIEVTYHYNDGRQVQETEYAYYDHTTNEVDYYTLQEITNVTWYNNWDLDTENLIPSNQSGVQYIANTTNNSVWACWNGNNNLTTKFTINTTTDPIDSVVYCTVSYKLAITNTSNIVIPNYIDDKPVRKVNIDNLYNKNYQSLTMPETLKIVEYSGYEWLYLTKQGNSIKKSFTLLSINYFEIMEYDDGEDGVFDSYENSSIKVYIDALVKGDNKKFTLAEGDTISLLNEELFLLKQSEIGNYNISKTWWLYDTYDFDGDIYISDVSKANVLNSCIDAGDAPDETFAVRPTITITL